MLKEEYSAALLHDQEQVAGSQQAISSVEKPRTDLAKLVLFGVKYMPSRGGTSRVAENMISQLRDKYSITIYCYDTVLRKQVSGIKVNWVKCLLPGAPGAFLFYLVSSIKILFGPKVDLVHAHKTDCALFIPLLRLRFKVIATSHEAPYRRDKWNFFMKVYFRLAERIFIYSSNMRTCVSEPLTKYYQKKYHRVVKFIPNGISCNYNGQDYRTELSYLLPNSASLDKPYVIFSARRLMSTKGCHTMIEALKRINYRGQVFITGELESSEKYVETLKKISGSLNIFFLGFVEPLPILLELIKGSEIFIFPSEVEGMSIMLLEVASIGKATVASDIPENTQVFDDTEVVYFENKSAEDLAIKLRFALDNPDTVRSMAEKAKNKVLTIHSWERIAEQYSQVYQSLLDQ